MTWKWAISGLGTAEQTCHVYDDSGTEVASKTQESWQWPTDEYPEYVKDIVAQNDFQAAWMGDIERDQSMLP